MHSFVLTVHIGCKNALSVNRNTAHVYKMKLWRGKTWMHSCSSEKWQLQKEKSVHKNLYNICTVHYLSISILWSNKSQFRFLLCIFCHMKIAAYISPANISFSILYISPTHNLCNKCLTMTDEISQSTTTETVILKSWSTLRESTLICFGTQRVKLCYRTRQYQHGFTRWNIKTR